MHRFAGFPAGGISSTPIPNLLFNDLLPQITSLAELKVTLHIFWALHQKKGFPRYVTMRELHGDGTLLVGLKALGDAPDQLLVEGLDAAVVRGTLLCVQAEFRGVKDDLYFVNTAHGREVVARLQEGELDIGQAVVGVQERTAFIPTASNVFQLYEQNVGLLTPLLAEQLSEAEKLYPQEWIADAFKQAVSYNRRNWKYIERILERWALEGKRDEEDRGSTRRVSERPAQYSRWRDSHR